MSFFFLVKYEHMFLQFFMNFLLKKFFGQNYWKLLNQMHLQLARGPISVCGIWLLGGHSVFKRELYSGKQIK